MAAEVWAAGGASTLTATLTTLLNSSAFDRLLKIHIAANGSDVTLTLDDGSKKFANALVVPANTQRSFGPFFLPNGTSLRGGSSGANGDARIDELRVNQ